MVEKLSVQKTLHGREQIFVEYLLYVSHCARHFTVHLTLTATSGAGIVISDSQVGLWRLREGHWLQVTQLGSGGAWSWIKVICCKVQVLPTGLKIITRTTARFAIYDVLTTRLTVLAHVIMTTTQWCPSIPIVHRRKLRHREVLSEWKVSQTWASRTPAPAIRPCVLFCRQQLSSKISTGLAHRMYLILGWPQLCYVFFISWL